MIRNEERWEDIENVTLPEIKDPGFESNVLSRKIWGSEGTTKEVAGKNEETSEEPVKAPEEVYLLRVRTNERIDIKKDRFVVGKGDSADYKIQGNPAISREHAVFTREGNRFYVEDMGSLNHTFVENEKISEKTKIDSGYWIKIADEEFVFVM